MMTIRLLTWNVLHRVHARNWQEPVIEGFPDETVRTARITDFVRRWLHGESEGAPDASVVCLQEVSGDQLASLAGNGRGDIAVFDHVYPRLPSLRRGSDPGLLDPKEHLVTLVKARAVVPQKISGRTFDGDPGKGFLAVDLGGVVVVNTHVSFGEKAAAQLALVAAGVRAGTVGGAAAGDFNATVETVSRAFGTGFVFTDLAGQGPTRVPASGQPGKTIDHVAACMGRIADSTVLTGEDLSDHRPVTATLMFP